MCHGAVLNYGKWLYWVPAITVSHAVVITQPQAADTSLADLWQKCLEVLERPRGERRTWLTSSFTLSKLPDLAVFTSRIMTVSGDFKVWWKYLGAYHCSGHSISHNMKLFRGLSGVWHKDCDKEFVSQVSDWGIIYAETFSCNVASNLLYSRTSHIKVMMSLIWKSGRFLGRHLTDYVLYNSL